MISAADVGQSVYRSVQFSNKRREGFACFIGSETKICGNLSRENSFPFRPLSTFGLLIEACSGRRLKFSTPIKYLSSLIKNHTH